MTKIEQFAQVKEMQDRYIAKIEEKQRIIAQLQRKLNEASKLAVEHASMTAMNEPLLPAMPAGVSPVRNSIALPSRKNFKDLNEVARSTMMSIPQSPVKSQARRLS